VTRKSRISLFCVLNVVTIVWANLPQSIGNLSSRAFVQMGSPPAGGPCVQCWRQLISRYGHITGFGGAWRLFTGLPRYQYWLTVKYVYSDEAVEERPRPYPTHRWAVLTPFLNHRENKIDLNLIGHDGTRIAYARFLCREEETRGRPVRSVQLFVHRLDIPALRQAVNPPPVEIVDQPFEVVLCGYGGTGTPS
jgi:hypothetical protein